MESELRQAIGQRLAVFQHRLANRIKLKATSGQKMLEDWLIRGIPFLGPDKLRRPYSQDAWVSSALNVISINGAQVPFRIKKKGTQDVLTDGDIFKLFRDVNPWMNRYMLWQSTLILLGLKGECFWTYEWLDGEDGPRTGPPKEIWVFGPDRFQPVNDPKTGIILGWKYTAPGKSSIYLEPEQVTRFWQFNPYEHLKAHASIKAAMDALATAYSARLYERMLLQNWAVPPGALIAKKRYGPKWAKDMKERWRETYGGPRKSADIAVLEGDVDFKQFALTIKDLQTTALRNDTREETLAALLMPPGPVGVMRYANYANLVGQIVMMWRQAIKPRLAYIQEELETSFFPRFAPELCGEFDYTVIPELQMAEKEKVELALKLLGGGITWRQIENKYQLGIDMEGFELADVSFLQSSLIPQMLGVVSEEGEQERSTDTQSIMGMLKAIRPTAESTPTKPMKLIDPQRARRARRTQKYLNSLRPLQKRMGNQVSTFFYNFRKATITNLMDMFGTLAAATTDESKALYRQKKIIVEEALQRDVVLPPACRDVDPELDALVAGILPHLDDQMAAYAGITIPIIEEGILLGGASTYREIAELGIDLGAFTNDIPTVVEYLTTKTLESKYAVKTVYRKMHDTLLTGLMEGEPASAIAERIRVIGRSSQAHAVTIARTEVVGAANNGKWYAEDDAGIQIHAWAHGGGVAEPRPSHEAADGEIVNFGDRFSTGLLHPHDWTSAGCAENCNCTCTLYVPTKKPDGTDYTLEELFGEEKAQHYWELFGEKIKLPSRYAVAA